MTLTRRPFLISSAALMGALMNRAQMNRSLWAVEPEAALEKAADVLRQSTESGQVRAATIAARIGSHSILRAFGQAQEHSSFLLGSISKPIAITACMRLVQQREVSLDDLARKYLPEFTGDGRDEITVRHLMTHVSGLPDQLPENAQLRRSHTSLVDFAKAAMRTPLSFAPGTKYQYSSMAILLATEIARRVTGKSILQLVDEVVTLPLKMNHSALGYGRLQRELLVPVQTENAAPEAGGGDPTAKDWDWNSSYWRGLGAPWGGMHASAADILKFLDAFVTPPDNFLSRETTRLILTNHNSSVRVPRGLGFGLGPLSTAPGCSETTFGHTGSTGTLAWLDPERERAIVVLTSLPGAAVKPHPRELASSCLISASR